MSLFSRRWVGSFLVGEEPSNRGLTIFNGCQPLASPPQLYIVYVCEHVNTSGHVLYNSNAVICIICMISGAIVVMGNWQLAAKPDTPHQFLLRHQMLPMER